MFAGPCATSSWFVAAFQLLETLEEVGTLLHHHRLVVRSRSSIFMASSATAVPIGLALKVECVEPGGKMVR